MISERSSRIPESSTVAIADLAARMRRDGHEVVDFSAGRAAEHSPDLVCEAAVAAMRAGRTHQTEARGLPEYLEAVAEKLARVNGVELDPRENVIATLGCKQGLVLSLLSVVDEGDEVIVEDPCFVSYAPTIELFGAVPVVVATDSANRYCWNEEALEAAVTEKTRAILFCSPHNPAGTVHGRDDLQVIAGVAQRHDLTVIADEIYEAVTWGGRRHCPVYTLPGMAERTIGLMGMTKTYSMGGWRIGYAYAAAHYIESMTKMQQHLMTCASSFGQIAAAKALQPDVIEQMQPLWQDWEARCEYVSDKLDAHGKLGVAMPEAASTPGSTSGARASRRGSSAPDWCRSSTSPPYRAGRSGRVATVSCALPACVPGRSFEPAYSAWWISSTAFESYTVEIRHVSAKS